MIYSKIVKDLEIKNLNNLLENSEYIEIALLHGGMQLFKKTVFIKAILPHLTLKQAKTIVELVYNSKKTFIEAYNCTKK